MQLNISNIVFELFNGDKSNLLYLYLQKCSHEGILKYCSSFLADFLPEKYFNLCCLQKPCNPGYSSAMGWLNVFEIVVAVIKDHFQMQVLCIFLHYAHVSDGMNNTDGH